MQTMGDEGGDIRTMLSDEALGTPIGPIPVDGLISVGRATVRRRRRYTFAAVACTTALVVGVPSSGLIRHEAAPHSARATSQTPDPEAGTISAWAEGLSSTQAPALAYAADSKLHVAESVSRLPGTSASLIGSSASGLVFSSEMMEGSEPHLTYAVLSKSGNVRQLPSFNSFATQNALLAPDGKQVAYGSRLVDIATGKVNAELPPDAQVLLSWTLAGLTYESTNGAVFLWRSGEQPIKLDQRPGYSSGATPIAFMNTADCSTVNSFTKSGNVREEFNDCGLPPLVSLSPEGDLALDSTLQVVDVSKGTRASLAGTDSVRDQLSFGQFAWISASKLAFIVTKQPGAGGSVDSAKAIIVDCDMVAKTCNKIGTSVALGPDRVVSLISTND